MIQEIICLAILYICLIGWLNAPKPTTTTEPNEEPIAAPVEATTSPPIPKPMIEPLPKPAYTATAPKAIAVPATTEPAQDLAALPIRTLYKLASQKGIKRVKSKSKAALVELLS